MSERTTFRRLPVRGTHDEQAIHAILDAAHLAHVGFVVDGQPFVIPTLFGRRGNTLFLHGSAVSRTMKTLATGIPVCLSVAMTDGLVLARSAFHHSVNYRSVMVFGTARLITDSARKNEALAVISDHLIAGRWAESRTPTEQELAATAVLELEIDEATAKSRTGGPKDDHEDMALPIWAGVLPLKIVAGEPVADELLSPGIPTSAAALAHARKLNGQ